MKNCCPRTKCQKVLRSSQIALGAQTTPAMIGAAARGIKKTDSKTPLPLFTRVRRYAKRTPRTVESAALPLEYKTEVDSAAKKRFGSR